MILILSIGNILAVATLVLLCLAVYFNTNILSDEEKNENKEAEPDVPEEAADAP